MTTAERVERTQQLTAQAAAMTVQVAAWTQQIEAEYAAWCARQAQQGK